MRCELIALTVIGTDQRRIQDFKLGGLALKNIAPSRERREHFWGISCETSYFFQILGGARAGCATPPPPPPWIRPC